ncbi:hypothetical protein LTR47_004735 [Exophiala xenobiotica]|nr:hypothetical protein LTR41_005423 [Exophiala xenobiotica]KAK5234144.1 hypothetical protein LTR47_004735 [Exophiala xenobiotica]KAK5253215.1 hypothetical protein LTS06_002421 [Exophiala xenobiotica]KAK5352823.1 hypothetical protein LTR61_003951 [Exophiala xenobiotica]KAK5375687.1 hypothetical protein LTR11_005239 [Exophiala xenobiotica]
MPAMTAARAADDFDMAKLQKSLKQRQRHAVRNSVNVAKLTPAEIRSLNNNSLSSKTGSQSSSQGPSPSTSRRSTTVTTPPSTPDDHASTHQAQSHRNSISRRSTVDIPTPPHTPNGHRRSSQSSTRGHGHTPIQSHANGVIYAPRPRVSGHAAFMAANGWSHHSSRPSSSGSSTYRGLPTYRGPEVTRHGSMNMLQRPAADIVANPLSYFSRPRQSVVGTSPERYRTSQEIPTQRPQSLHGDLVSNVSAVSSRAPSPPRATDSPVSMLVDETEKFPILDPAEDPHNQPKIYSDEEQPTDDKPQIEETSEKIPAQAVAEHKVDAPLESPRKDVKKRFTLSSALFGTEKNHQDGEENAKKLKKGRRRTLSFGKSLDKEIFESIKLPAEEQPPAPNEEAKVDGAMLEEGDFSAHPAVRPLSLIIPSEFKGKEKEVYSAPVFSKCSCCGKVKRPAGYTNELSPVFENEHLRTNFSFEIERTSGSMEGRRTSESSRGKFTPIIPVKVGENETRQAIIEHEPPAAPISQNETRHARIEPPTGPISPVRQVTQRMDTSPKRRVKRTSDSPKFVRFASLHGRRRDTTVIDEEDEIEIDENAPLMNGANSQPREVKTIDFAVHDQVTQSPLEVGHDMKTVPDERDIVSQTLALASDPATEVSRRTSNVESLGSDKFFTPPRGPTPAVESVKSGKGMEMEKEETPTGHPGNPMMPFLREPSFGPTFARNSASLKDFVLSRSTSIQMSDAGSAGRDLTVHG